MIVKKSKLLDFVTKAHGDLKKWNSLNQVEVDLLIRGNLLAYKGISPRKRKMKVTIHTKSLYAVLDPFPTEGLIGIYQGGSVTIKNKVTEQKVSELLDARNSCKSKILWNDLNLLYFLGYALWNYVNTPFLFHWDGFQVNQLEPIKIKNEILNRLEVIFPKSIPTHCSKQIFFFSENGLLKRLDYTAEIFGNFLVGSHICEEHKIFEGYSFPTHRIVFPRFKNTPIPFLPSAMEGWIEKIKFK